MSENESLTATLHNLLVDLGRQTAAHRSGENPAVRMADVYALVAIPTHYCYALSVALDEERAERVRLAAKVDGYDRVLGGLLDSYEKTTDAVWGGAHGWYRDAMKDDIAALRRQVGSLRQREG